MRTAITLLSFQVKLRQLESLKIYGWILYMLHAWSELYILERKLESRSVIGLSPYCGIPSPEYEEHQPSLPQSLPYVLRPHTHPKSVGYQYWPRMIVAAQSQVVLFRNINAILRNNRLLRHSLVVYLGMRALEVSRDDVSRRGRVAGCDLQDRELDYGLIR